MALVPCGTTGEIGDARAPTSIAGSIEVCVEPAAGRVPVIAGCGSNDTADRDRTDAAAKERGADAALRRAALLQPAQPGGHLRPFRGARRGRRPADRRSTTCRRGRSPTSRSRRWRGWPKLPNVVGDQGRDRQSRPRLRPARSPAARISSSSPAMTTWRWASRRWAASGCISVTANVAPRLCADFQNACLSGDWATALALQDRLYPLHAALFSDASPGPVKYALSRVRPDFPAELRLPMTPPSEASRTRRRRGARTCGASA